MFGLFTQVMVLITNVGSGRSITKDIPYDVVLDGTGRQNILHPNEYSILVEC